MQVDDSFFPLIEYFEGFKPCPYLDKAGIATIGIGTTYYPGGVRVTMHDICVNETQARTLLKSELGSYEEVVTALAGVINQNQFNALVSFSYNEGTGAFKSSTLLRVLRANPNDPQVTVEFAKWNKVRDPKTHQLIVNSWQVKRRRMEAELYFKPV